MAITLEQILQKLATSLSASGGTNAPAYVSIKSSIYADPYLLEKLSKAAIDGIFKEITLIPFDGSGGNMKGTTLRLPYDERNVGDLREKNIQNLTYLLGHEIQHAFNAGERKKLFDKIDKDIQSLAGSSGSKDYGPLIKRYVNLSAWDEASAAIGGWNALIARERAASPTIDDASLRLKLKDSTYSTYFLDSDGNFLPNIKFNANLTVSYDEALGSNDPNINALKTNYYLASGRGFSTIGALEYINLDVSYILGVISLRNRNAPITVDFLDQGITPAQIALGNLYSNAGGPLKVSDSAGYNSYIFNLPDDPHGFTVTSSVALPSGAGTSTKTYSGKDPYKGSEPYVKAFDLNYKTSEGTILERTVVDKAGNRLYGTVSTTTPDGKTSLIFIDSKGLKIELSGILSGDSTTGDLNFTTTSIDKIGNAGVESPALAAAAVADSGFNPFTGEGLASLRPVVEQSALDPDVKISLLDSLPKPTSFWTSTSQLGSTISAARGLIDAVNSGNTFAIASATFNIVNIWSTNSTVHEINAGIGVLNDIKSLRASLDHGDVLGAVRGGLSLTTNALTIYQSQLLSNVNELSSTLQGLNLLRAPTEKVAQDLAAANLELTKLTNTLKDLTDVLPYLNIAISLKNGNYVDAAVAAVAIAFPVVGYVYAALKLVFSLTRNDTPYGHAVAVQDATGPIKVSSYGDNGGDQKVRGVLTTLIQQLNSLLPSLPGQALVAERLPEINFNDPVDPISQLSIKYVDQRTGVTHYINFDSDGHAFSAGTGTGRNVVGASVLGTEDFFKNIGVAYLEAAFKAGAIVPQWVADTTHLQHATNDANAAAASQAALNLADYWGYWRSTAINNGKGISPTLRSVPRGKPGLGTIAWAKQDGTLLPQAANATTQAVRPIVLDLNGDGIKTLSRADGYGVLFDVDDDGFAETTDWVDAHDGILVLDYSGDDKIEGGHEIFNDVGIDTAKRGLGVLKEIDANFDGKLNSDDPAFSHLQVWRDINLDGIVQDYELQTFADLGITSLDFRAGTFTQNGVTRTVAQANLTADTKGIISSFSKNSVFVLGEDNTTKTLVTGVRNLADLTDGEIHSSYSDDGKLYVGDDGVEGLEDTVLIVGAAQLLANDKLNVAGLDQTSLRVTGTGNAKDGTVSFDSQTGVIKFTPNANFFGSASFEYTAEDGTGRKAKGIVVIDVQAVNDAPDVQNVGNERAAVLSDLSKSAIGFYFADILSRNPNTRLGTNPAGATNIFNVANNNDGTYIDVTANIHGVPVILGKTPDGTLYGQTNGAWYPIIVPDKYNGSIVGNDVESGKNLKYEINDKALYGKAVVDATGHWTYTKPEITDPDTYVPKDDSFSVKVTDPDGGTKVIIVVINETDTGEPKPQQQRRGVGANDSTHLGSAGGVGSGVAAAAAAGTVPPRRDPLAFDLDGDGIETVSNNQGKAILFDHDADGIKTGTGWLAPDDGWLALDKNGNGTIDSGRELFGVDTILKNGQNAANGFAALADQDSNNDGVINASDTIFANLRIWRDLNQDGISQANELTTLAQNNITSISLGSTPAAINFGNGNVQTAAGTFTRSDGTTGISGEITSSVGNLDLLQNTFYRDFTDKLDINEQIAALPELRGSGQVRNLSEAISLSGELGYVVWTYTQATTRNEQIQMLDDLVTRWAGTSTFKSLQEQATDLAASGVRVVYNLQGLTVGSAAYNDFLKKIQIVEKFVGFTYGGVSGGLSTTPLSATSGTVTLNFVDAQIANILLAYERIKGDIYESLALDTIYKDFTNTAIKETSPGVYDLSGIDTYFDAEFAKDPQAAAIKLVEIVSAWGEVNAKAVGWDAMAYLAKKLTSVGPLNAFTEELSSWTVRFLTQGASQLVGAGRDDLIIGSIGLDTIYGGAGNDLIFGNAGDDSISGDMGNDSLFGGDGNDLLNGEVGDDTLEGGSGDDRLLGSWGDDTLRGGDGNDTLTGDAGNDILDGGRGDDTLIGADGSNIYLFGRGDGIDLIKGDNFGTVGLSNTLQLKAGVLAADVKLSRVENSLVLSIIGTTDSITAWNFFNNDNPSSVANPIQQVKFNDGTVWNLATLVSKSLAGTSGNDTILGLLGDDIINGLDGNDIIEGKAGNDKLDGGMGIDTLRGGDGGDTLIGDLGNDYLLGENDNDILLGGEGSDTLMGGFGDDIYDGGAGNDFLRAGTGNDTYLFGRGDGEDEIKYFSPGYDQNNIFSSTVDGLNTLQFKAGVSSNEVFASRQTNDLILTIIGTSDKITVRDFFKGNDPTNNLNPLQQIKFNDGTSWNIAAIVAKIFQGSAGNDSISGTLGDDQLFGLGGDDVISGGAGNDTIDGGADADVLNGDGGNDTLTGGDGNDDLYGGAGDDILDGGTGNDRLTGGTGNNIYHFGRGDGIDLISLAVDTLPQDISTLQLKAGIQTTDVTVSRDGSDLLLSINGTVDKITVQYFFEAGNVNYSQNPIQQLIFADGTVWNIATLINKANAGTAGDDTLNGTNFDDTINGLGGNDVIDGLIGNDTLDGGEGNDTLLGGEGNDKLIGGAGDDSLDGGVDDDMLFGGDGNDTLDGYAGNDALDGGAGTDTLRGGLGDDLLLGKDGDDNLFGEHGNDVLDGGFGNDTLTGGVGDNTYLFGRGDGQDVIISSNDTTPTKINTLQFKAGVLASDVTVQNLSGALVISINGTTDKVSTGSFEFVPTATNNSIQRVRFDDGTIWDLAAIISRSKLPTEFADNLYGTAGNDTINGLGGDDSIQGLEGDDILDGGTGADSLSGGQGNDTYIVDNVGDYVFEGNNLGNSYDDNGVDTVISSITYTLLQNIENLTLTGTAAINATGNTLDNVVRGNSGNNVLNGGTGADALSGGAGNDTYVIDNIGDTVTELANEGTDLVQSSVSYTLGANVENLTLTGTAALNATGNTLANTLTGNSGNNILDGGAGVDTLIGGAGNDTYIVDETADVITEAASAGTDLVQSSASYTLAVNLENLTLTGSANINGTGNTVANTIRGNTGNNILDGGAGVDTLIGGTGDDIYVVDVAGDIVTENANEGNDTIQSAITYTLGTNLENLTLMGTSAINGTGNAINNLITGNSGNNVLDGGTGADTLIGGAGNDTYVVDNAGDTITENTNEGTDLVQSSLTYTLGTNLENLTLTGTAAINGTGNALANTITGNAGDNILDGGAGIDTLVGGAGNDTYIVDATGDIITEAASAGTDLVQSAATYTLGANLENLTLTGTAAINGTGNTQANIITGNSGNNILDGGAGIDTLVGGAGNDTYVVDVAGDVVTENANEGTDTVQSAVTYTLGANLENLTLTGTGAINGTGNALVNTITGNAGNNVLDGGAGADILIGGAGNDTYVVDNVGDVVTEIAAGGTDLVQSSISYTLGTEVENLTLTGTTAINGTGNALANTITGNAGDNILDGGAGIDTLVGGAGNDTYVVDVTGDIITEAASAGTDLVQSSATYTLGANLENLTLTGNAAINGSGNTLDNILRGNSAANVLAGGTGNDTYYISTGDSITEAASAGTDTVVSDVTWVLGTNLENLTLFGTASINGTGNTVNNILIGNTGNNILDGGTGADTLTGGAGNDTYVIDNVGDVVTENASEGIDAVQSSITYTLTANVEALTLTGATAINGTGNASDNLLIGNSANNTLNGAAGNDILQGGAGVDTLTDTLGNNVLDGGAGDDIITAGDGKDFIAGGIGNDTITTGAGADAIAFNRGDGQDIINVSTVKDNTLSLGKGIKYADLTFKKTGNDLILVTGTNEQVTVKDWYLNTTNHSIANLQIVIEGTTDYIAGSTNQLNNKKIEQFNFDGLVTKFDQARVANPALTSWALSSSLLEFYLTGSDTAAIGGDLAYQYAKNGNLSSFSYTPAQTLLANASFGSASQSLQATANLQDASIRLV